MADDKRNPGRPDRDRIDVSEDYELWDWSEKFGVSKEELAAAVKRVGPIAKDVEAEQKKAPCANG
jgi:predicted transcriptional regulator